MLSKNRRILWLCFLFCGLLILSTGLLAEEKQTAGDSVSFKYGIIGKTQAEPENFFEVTDTTILKSGDFFKINFKLESRANFYVLFKFANGEYYLYHSASNLTEKSTSGAITTSLDWLELDNNIGTETIYLIASKEPLTELEQLLLKYQGSKRKLKRKLARKIAAELTSLTREKKKKLVLLQSRLKKPENIGGTFRGTLDKKEIENYLFNFCSGEKTIFKIVKIKHK